MTAEREDGRRLAYLLLTFTALFWAGNVIVGRGLADHIPPLGLNFWRWLVALLVLLPFTWRSLLNNVQTLKAHWKLLTIFGILGVTCFNSFAYVAMQTTTAINVSVLNTLMPICVVAMSWAFFRNGITSRQGLGIFVSSVGALTIIGKGSAHALMTLTVSVGDLWMMLGMLSYATYTAMLRLRPPALDQLTFLAAVVLFGLLPTAPVYVAESVLSKSMLFDRNTVLAVLYVGIFPSVLAYYFWAKGISLIGANRGTLFIHLMPVFGVILAMTLLGEALRWFHLAGFVLILLGMLMALKPRSGNGRDGTQSRASDDDHALRSRPLKINL